MTNGSGVSRGDRNRNARLARLRELVPVSNAIVGIDLADRKQMVVVTDHDYLLLIGQVDPDDRVAHRHRSTQLAQPCVPVPVATRDSTPARYGVSVVHERPPSVGLGHQARIPHQGGRSLVYYDPPAAT